MPGFVYAKNKVPEKQRYYQAHDGKRLWHKPPSARIYLPIYHVILWGSFAGALWMSGRMVFGHKTWFSDK